MQNHTYGMYDTHIHKINIHMNVCHYTQTQTATQLHIYTNFPTIHPATHVYARHTHITTHLHTYAYRLTHASIYTHTYHIFLYSQLSMWEGRSEVKPSQRGSQTESQRGSQRSLTGRQTYLFPGRVLWKQFTCTAETH